jgi:hypothetical protein
MLILLRLFLATLPSILRSRTALELENLALRHQVGVLRRSAAKRPKLTPWDGLLWIGLSRLMARLALSAGHRQAGDGRILASRWLPPVLDLEGAPWPTGTTPHFEGG